MDSENPDWALSSHSQAATRERDAEWDYLEERCRGWRGQLRWTVCWLLGHRDRSSIIRPKRLGVPACRYCGLGWTTPPPRWPALVLVGFVSVAFPVLGVALDIPGILAVLAAVIVIVTFHVMLGHHDQRWDGERGR